MVDRRCLADRRRTVDDNRVACCVPTDRIRRSNQLNYLADFFEKCSLHRRHERVVADPQLLILRQRVLLHIREFWDRLDVRPLQIRCVAEGLPPLPTSARNLSSHSPTPVQSSSDSSLSSEIARSATSSKSTSGSSRSSSNASSDAGR